MVTGWVFPVFQIYNKARVEVFACLGSSHGFLSTIFGILDKFWILKIFFEKIFYFSKSKKISKKSEILKKWEFFGILMIFNGFPYGFLSKLLRKPIENP